MIIYYERGTLKWILKKNARLRELLKKDEIVVAPGCHDTLTARIIQETGFPVAYMGGNGSMASYIGLPDIGLNTETEMVTRARYCTAKLILCTAKLILYTQGVEMGQDIIVLGTWQSYLES